MKNIFISFVKKELVLCIAGMLAIVSAFFVHPDLEYINYIDFKVLAILFCNMTIIGGLEKNNVFENLAKALIRITKSIRSIKLLMIFMCFFWSMLITNDVALITFVPFTIMLFRMLDKKESIAYLVVLETIAANLGSMLTPVGNPQNLYLYNCIDIGFFEFIKLMLPYTLVSLILLIVLVWVDKNELTGNLHKLTDDKESDGKKTIVYTLLFMVTLGTVLRLYHFIIPLLVVFLVVIMIDRKIFKNIDYSLLLTFVFFFIFIGNMGRMEIVTELITKMLRGREMILAVFCSQFMSNVPAAILLSGFTTDIKALIVGTNLGGLGTLIASLASLISYKFYVNDVVNIENNSKISTKKYMIIFTIANIFFLIILGGVWKILN